MVTYNTMWPYMPLIVYKLYYAYMKKATKTIIIIGIIILLLVFLYQKEDDLPLEKSAVGIVAALTGDLAWWGEGTVAGAKLAQYDLAQEGVDISLYIEDGSLDPVTALNAAQKIVFQGDVQAMYTEFNPATIAIGSYLKDKDIHFIYDSAPVSPLEESENYFKTYIDYTESCKQAALIAQERGFVNPGVMKINLEYGDLCLEGIKLVYDNVFVESYNPGGVVFGTEVTKLKNENVDVLFNVTFPSEMIKISRALDDQDFNPQQVVLLENLTDDVIANLPNSLEGTLSFGLPPVDEDFIDRINTSYGEVSNYQSAALAYIHIKHLARAVEGCGRDVIAQSDQEPIIGFRGFTDRKAQFTVEYYELIQGELVRIIF